MLIDINDNVKLVEEVGRLLIDREWRLTTAESCTGGLIAKLITDVPGCSEWYDCGIVSYSNQIKMTLLGVPEEVLDYYGAVSEKCVIAMAQGALKLAQANISVAVSGIAGPSGGSPEKPVGTVWIGWADNDRGAFAVRHWFSGNRDDVRRKSAESALLGVLDYLQR